MLQTSRLVLRPLEPDDLPDLIRYHIRSEFIRYLPIPVQTPETIAKFLNERLAEESDPNRKGWEFGIVPKDVGHVVGTVRIGLRPREDRAAYLAYGIDIDFRGRGYVTEAVNAVIAFGFDELKLHRIWATADIENPESTRVMERVGMHRECLMREDKFIRGEWRSSLLYAILVSDGRTSQ